MIIFIFIIKIFDSVLVKVFIIGIKILFKGIIYAFIIWFLVKSFMRKRVLLNFIFFRAVSIKIGLDFASVGGISKVFSFLRFSLLLEILYQLVRIRRIFRALRTIFFFIFFIVIVRKSSISGILLKLVN